MYSTRPRFNRAVLLIAGTAFAFSLIGFILAWFVDPDAINMCIGSAIAGVFLLVMARILR